MRGVHGDAVEDHTMSEERGGNRKFRSTGRSIVLCITEKAARCGDLITPQS